MLHNRWEYCWNHFFLWMGDSHEHGTTSDICACVTVCPLFPHPATPLFHCNLIPLTWAFRWPPHLHLNPNQPLTIYTGHVPLFFASSFYSSLVALFLCSCDSFACQCQGLSPDRLWQRLRCVCKMFLGGLCCSAWNTNADISFTFTALYDYCKHYI